MVLEHDAPNQRESKKGTCISVGNQCQSSQPGVVPSSSRLSVFCGVGHALHVDGSGPLRCTVGGGERESALWVVCSRPTMFTKHM